MVTSIKGNDTSTFGGNVDVTGNVITDAPAFSAYLSSVQSVTSGVVTKIQIDTVSYDTTSDFDTSLYRYTPSVAGYYQINCTLRTSGSSQTTQVAQLFKNGANVNQMILSRDSTSSTWNQSCSTQVYLNGTTDYIEFYGLVSASSPAFSYAASNNTCIFSGYLSRAV